MTQLVCDGLQQVGSLQVTQSSVCTGCWSKSHPEVVDCPELGVVNVHVPAVLGEVGVSQGPAWSVLREESKVRKSSVRCSQGTYKGIAISVLVSVEPDLDVDLAPVQPLEGEARHLLPHGEGLADRLVHVRPADPAGGGVAQDP